MPDRPDPWAAWLTQRRDAGDERQRRQTLAQLAPVRDRVLAAAGDLEGATVLDVGCGDGLIGLEALQRVGPGGSVVFSDISAALLEQVQRAVEAQGLGERAWFVRTGAEDLAGIADGSVDVVTTRSVLIYVADKRAALTAMRRVLRERGRISLFEPINRLMYPEPADRLWGYDVAAVRELAGRVKHAFGALSDDATRSMMDFDDRDLVDAALAAGFAEIHLTLTVDIVARATPAVSFDSFLDGSPNPLAPTLRETIERALSPPERERLLAQLRAAFAAGGPSHRRAVAYLDARCASPAR